VACDRCRGKSAAPKTPLQCNSNFVRVPTDPFEGSKPYRIEVYWAVSVTVEN